jgi:hypothetical protein
MTSQGNENASLTSVYNQQDNVCAQFSLIMREHLKLSFLVALDVIIDAVPQEKVTLLMSCIDFNIINFPMSMGINLRVSLKSSSNFYPRGAGISSQAGWGWGMRKV